MHMTKDNNSYLVKLIFASFRVVDSRLVSVVAEMSRCNKTVTAWAMPVNHLALIHKPSMTVSWLTIVARTACN
jgi:hypothetical protein